MVLIFGAVHTPMMSIDRIRTPDSLAFLARGASVALAIQISGAGMKYVIQILFARWMGPAEYGSYIYAFTWAQLLGVLAGLGLTTGVLRFIPEYLASRDWSRLRGVVKRSRQLTFITGFVFATFSTIVIVQLHPSQIHIPSLLVGLWLVPLLALLNLQMEMTRGTRRIALAYMPPLLIYPALAAGAAFLVLRVSGALTSVSALGAVSMALMVVLSIQAFGFKRALPREADHVTPYYETARWLRVSFPLLLIAGFFIVLNQADILLIGLLRGPKEAGIYAAATKTAALVSFVLTAFNSITAPMIASLHASADRSSLQRVVSAATRWTFWPSLIIALGLILFGGPILKLFGSDFAAGRWPLALLSLGQLANASAGPVGYLMSLTGYQDLSARVYGLSALVNVILNAAIIPIWGLAGAALVTMSTMVLWNVWLYFLVKRHLGVSSFAFARRIETRGLP